MSPLLPRGHLIQLPTSGLSLGTFLFFKKGGKIGPGLLVLLLGGVLLSLNVQNTVVLTWPVFLGERSFQFL